ncbi:MAG: sigma-70 family RNA polymerase sigma factor [Planctomycetes bacterium]|nr:sigma-70 family RNA polymerase sigma factor [Planctomycetota bacterium]
MSVNDREREPSERARDARFSMKDLKEGRPEALNEMIRTLTPPLYRFVSRMLNQAADVEDVLQTVFLKVLGGLNGFDGRRDRFRSWVFTIAYRASVDVLRERHRTELLRHDPPAGPPEPPLHHDLSPIQIRRALDSLHPDDRLLLTLRFQEGFSNRDIAEILGVTPNHAGVLLYRAKQNLRRAFR